MENNEVDSDIHAPSTSHTTTGSGSDERLIEIFEKEIDTELAHKMGAFSEISDNIIKCQRMLDRLRKEAVTQYYMGFQQDSRRAEQPSIHPAVKKLIGKKPLSKSQTDQFLASNIAEWKRETRKKLLKKCFSTKHKKSHSYGSKDEKSSDNNSIIRPRYIPPSIPGNPQENSSLRGNKKKMHIRILIGNVAKQIQSDPDTFDPASHKWMVYVRSAPGSLAVDREVSRVNFFLHPSYKPHDIVTVPSPPFTLNRRGWGEFPMRVQLHFKNRLNDPANIIHHLKLNGARSGHHTRSAETFADLWIYPHKSSQENKAGNAGNSEDILLLASNMLKEEVPDFTSEVICSKCQTTSVGTDSHNCTCDIKDITQESESNYSSEDSSDSSIGDYESSDSDDSEVESMTPKPLSCWGNLSGADISEDSRPSFEKKIKEEELSHDDFCNDSNISDIVETNGSCSAFGTKKNGIFKELNFYETQEDSSTKVKTEVGSYSDEPDCSRLPANTSQFSGRGSDILNVEVSDIMEALGLDAEVKEEPQDYVEKSNVNIKTEEFYGNTITSKDIEELMLVTEVDNLPKNKIQPMEVDFNQVENKHLDEVENKHLDQVENKHLNQAAIKYLDQIEEKHLEELERIHLAKLGNEHFHQVENIVFENNNEMNSVQIIPDSDISSLTTEKPFQESHMVIEEVPIDEFINNIVEEEIVVEIPVKTAEDEIADNSKTAVEMSEVIVVESPAKDEIKHNSKPAVEMSQEIVVESPAKTAKDEIKHNSKPAVEMSEVIVVESPAKTAKDKIIDNSKTAVKMSGTQTSTSLGRDSTLEVVKTSPGSTLKVKKPPLPVNNQFPGPTEMLRSRQSIPTRKNPITSLGGKVIIPGENPLMYQKAMLISNQVSSAKQPLRTGLKYVRIQPLTLTTAVEGMKELAVQRAKAANGTVQFSLPYTEIPAKSPKYIQIKKENILSNKVTVNSNHVLKKIKIDELNYVPSKTEKNILVSQGSSILRSPRIATEQSCPKVENVNYKVVNAVPKIVVEQNKNSVNKTQNTSLLKPQFRNNNISKLNFRNPNSLLRPILPKSNIAQPNSSSSLHVQKPIKQSLQSTRPLTYSVLKSTMNNAGTKQNIRLQSTAVNPLIKSPNSPTNIQNIEVNQRVPELHKTIVYQKDQQLISAQSNNQIKSTSDNVEHSLSKEILKLSHSLFKRESETRLEETNSSRDLPETIKSPLSGPDECEAPESSGRQSNSSDPKTTTTTEENSPSENCAILKRPFEILENKVDLNDIGPQKPTMSFYELIKVIHFPKTSVPSRPVIYSSGGIEKVKALELDFVSSCNSLHNDLQQLQFERKVLVNKDKMNLTINEQVFYYLEQLRLLVNMCVFNEMESAVRWLVRGLPLVHPDARLMAYKVIHPYCAVSTEAYCSWPHFRQAAAEWLRAKTVSRLLTALNAKEVLSEPPWSTKTIYWWCRTHGYSPAFCLIGFETPSTSSAGTDLVQKLQKISPPTNVLEWLTSVHHKRKSITEEEVDIVVDDSQENEGRHNKCKNAYKSEEDGTVLCGRPWVRDMHSYVLRQMTKMRETSKREKDPPVAAAGPLDDEAATLLSHSAVTLAEDLLRRGLANAAHRGSGSLEPRDVCRVILKRPEFDVFTSEGLEVDLSFKDKLKGPKPP